MPEVEHVVVLMLENRSFDHLLGFLDHPKEEFGRLEPGSFSNVDGQGRTVPVSCDGQPSGLRPDHSHAVACEQMDVVDGVENGGFLRQPCRRKRLLSRRMGPAFSLTLVNV